MIKQNLGEKTLQKKEKKEMNINEEREGKVKQQKFWDAIRVTARVAGAAIAQMHRLCRVCVQTGAADR